MRSSVVRVLWTVMRPVKSALRAKEPPMKPFCLVLVKHLAAIIGLVAAGTAGAAYPEKPITLLVGSATGGGIDLLARNVAKLMSASMNSPIVVENRAGAAGLIAVEATVKAKPDG